MQIKPKIILKACSTLVNLLLFDFNGIFSKFSPYNVFLLKLFPFDIIDDINGIKPNKKNLNQT